MSYTTKLFRPHVIRSAHVRIYVFCMDLRTNNAFFLLCSNSWLIFMYNRDGMCSLRGTNQILKYNLVSF